MLEKGNRANTLHGILLIALFSFAAFYIAELPVVRRLSFSPLIVGIVCGAYSSVCITGALWFVMKKKQEKAGAKKA